MSAKPNQNDFFKSHSSSYPFLYPDQLCSKVAAC